MKKMILQGVILFLAIISNAQDKKGIISGPMLGQVEIRTAVIWIEAGSDAKTVAVRYWKKGNTQTARTKNFPGNYNAEFKTMQTEIGGLEMNTTYEYVIVYNGIQTKFGGTFTTKDFWRWHKPAPDFSFLAGSCAYFNERIYDRPGNPYGQDSSIFETMAKEPAAFMLWLGDNWYTREADYDSEWGLWYRASRDRSLPVLQSLWKAMPQYAIWDDHDYGYNDADKSYVLKDKSRNVFMQYWANPSYGMDGKGIYTKISYSDVDMFLMDDRYFRSNDEMADSVNGKPNPAKRMWGEEQMDWLKNALISSKATFKIIATGSQTLNRISTADCLQRYPVEFNELMDFLRQEKINGLLFLTGDRHRSEIIRYERAGTYALYDVTTSPLTSGIAQLQENEKNNPDRIQSSLIERQNYARITVAGDSDNRSLTVEFMSIKGESLAKWSINEKELQTPKE